MGVVIAGIEVEVCGASTGIGGESSGNGVGGITNISGGSP